MTAPTDVIAETTDPAYGRLMTSNSPDSFDDALADLRVTGSVLVHDTYAAPWAILIPPELQLRPMLGVGSAARIMPFHLVLEGGFELAQGHLPAQTVEAREVAICPGGEEHLMRSGRVGQPTPFADVMAGKRPRQHSAAAAGPTTTLLCGVFVVSSAPLNPLLAALPSVLKVSTAGSNANPLLVHAAEMLAFEVARGCRASFTASRMLEVFCAEAIASYRRDRGAEQPGWFRALDDPKIGTALEHLHRQPGRPWTVEDLAETVALSPSRFAARFRETTGQSVMSYVAEWRMNVACRLLRETEGGLAEIAAGVGYTDVASFSRAFKALVGESPSSWRAGNRD